MRSRTCPRSGGASKPSDWAAPRPAATPRGSSSAPRRGHRGRRDHRRHPGHRGDPGPHLGSPRVLQPATQVQDRHLGLAEPGRRARGQRRVLRGVDHPEHGPGFDVWVGGGLSTNPISRSAWGLGAAGEVADVWAGVIGIFRDYGYRRLRNRARLKFLVADWGAATFREVLETEYLGRACSTARPVEDRRTPSRPRRHPPAARRQGLGRRGSDRRPGQRHDPRAGRRPGRRALRLGPHPPHGPPEAARPRHRPEPALPTWIDELAAHGPPKRPQRMAPRRAGLHRDRVLQARLTETKARARDTVEELERRLPGPRHPRDAARQRLPQLVRPVPGRRHRPQRPGHERRRGPRTSRASRSTSVADSAATLAGPQDPRPAGARRTSSPITSSA
jgi:hypothetical protein